MKKTKKKKSYSIEWLFPSLKALKARKKIVKYIENIENNNELILEEKINNDEYYKFVIETLDKNSKRKETIEDKSKSTLLVIAVIITFIIGTLTTFDKFYSHDIFGIVFLIILFFGILFLLLGTIHAIQVLNIKEYYRDDIMDYLEIDGKDVKEKNKIGREGLKENLKRLFKYNRINENIILIKCNFAYASFISIRNGIVIIVLFFLLIICKNAFLNYSKDNKAPKTSSGKVEKDTLYLKDTVLFRIPINYKIKIDIEKNYNDTLNN
jgi:hypothetical protein